MKETIDSLANVQGKSNLIEANLEEKKIEHIQKCMKILELEILERIGIIEEDIQKWKCYMKRFDEMMSWVDSKKSIMDLQKPKEKTEIDMQKSLLEVCYYFHFELFCCVFEN